MNADDILQLQKIIKEELKPLNDSMIEICRNNQTMCQTVYGSDGQSGMRHVVSTMKNDVEELKQFRTQVKAVAGTVFGMVQVELGLLGLWLRSLFTKG